MHQFGFSPSYLHISLSEPELSTSSFCQFLTDVSLSAASDSRCEPEQQAGLKENAAIPHTFLPCNQIGLNLCQWIEFTRRGQKSQQQNIHPTDNLYNCQREHSHLLFKCTRMVSCSFNAHSRNHFLKATAVQNDTELHFEAFTTLNFHINHGIPRPKFCLQHNSLSQRHE